MLSQIFLPRLGHVVDAIVGDALWFERDELRKKFDQGLLVWNIEQQLLS